MTAYKSLEAALKAKSKEILREVDKVARLLMNDQARVLTEAVAPWKHKSVFRLMGKPTNRSLLYQMVQEGTDDALRIFEYVDKGTKPHLIFPKGGRFLRFRTGYNARTAAIANPAAGSGRSSGPVVFSRGVAHPGNEAREFVAYSALETEDGFKQGVIELKKRL